MDTNNNSRLEMDLQQEQTDQLPQTQQDQQSGEVTTMKQETHENNEDQNPDRIELYVKYDASDALRDESGTQTPIEDEPSQGTGDASSITTISNCNNNQQQQLELSASNNSTSDDLSKSNKTMVIRVQESEDENAESIEIELEDDNSLLLTSLTSLFPDATGLVFRHPVTNQRRAVKYTDGKFAEPTEGWSFAKNYICVFNRGAKRKTDDDNDGGKKVKTDPDRPGPDGGSDLVVLGLPWTTTEDTMRTYFEQYGEVVMVQVKTEKNGKSRGFGFVRFAKSSIQNKLLSMRHFIDGRWCDVRYPLSKAEADATKAAHLSRKIFVGRLPDNITPDDLRNHFSEYGTLTDVFIPKNPFRNFAFVTFGTSDMAQSIFKHKHVIKGSPVTISEAIPKDNAPPNSYGGGGGGGFNNGPQPNPGGYGGAVGYIGNANNNIHPFNNSYGAHQVPYHHHGKNNVAGNFGGGVYQNNRKMHPQSTYYQMPSFGSSGPSSSVDATSYANHSAHSDYGAFGGAAGAYNQPAGGVNGGQYYKMQQQPVMTSSNQNHSTYPNQSSYSTHGANTSRSSYGSVWK